MAKLVCDDCGEVLEEDLTESEAEDAKEQYNAEDHRHDVDDEREGDADEQGDGAGGASGLDERTDVEEMEDDLEDDFEEKMDELNDPEGVEDTVDDVEDYADAADAENMNIDVTVGTGNVDPGARWEQAQNEAEPISRIFKDKLRQMRKNKRHYEQRSGKFDSNRMMAADRGNPRVFTREEEGDEAEYEAYFVLDRSYSMKHTEMKPAEDAVGTLMIALEEAGVKTELVDFMDDDVRVIKTKSQDAQEENGNILVGGSHAEGGTPLGAVLQLSSERITGSEGDPFVVVVTDGKPGSTSNYKDALQDLNADGVEVLGVTIGSASSMDQATKDRLFNHHVTVEDNSMLTEKLKDLARGVMF